MVGEETTEIIAENKIGAVAESGIPQDPDDISQKDIIWILWESSVFAAALLFFYYIMIGTVANYKKHLLRKYAGSTGI